MLNSKSDNSIRDQNSAVDEPSIDLCAVIDSDPRVRVQAVVWAISASEHVSNARLRMVAVGDLPIDLKLWLQAKGVRITHSDTRPVSSSPHSNKILALESPPEWSAHTVICDADLFFASDPSKFLTSSSVLAVDNYHSVPPKEIYRRCLTASGIEAEAGYSISILPHPDSGLRGTFANNHNGALISVPSELRSSLFQRWKHWACWLEDNPGLLAEWSIHTDQVGFALACDELGIQIGSLAPQLNAFPHLFDHLETIIGFHLSSSHSLTFAHYFDSDGFLLADRLNKGLAADLKSLNVTLSKAFLAIEAIPSIREHRHFLAPSQAGLIPHQGRVL